MTEPIDQATKDLIEKEAYDSTIANYHTTELETNQWYRAYVAGATVWAEKLKQERNKAIDECIDAVLDKSTEAERFTKFSYQEVKTILQGLKDKES